VDGIDFLVQLGAENYGQNDMLSGDGLQNAKSRQLMGPRIVPRSEFSRATKVVVPQLPVVRAMDPGSQVVL
jgi:hypothetical protein